MKRFIALGFICCIGLVTPALGQEESESGARRLLESIGQKIENVAKRLTTTNSERDKVSRELQAIETELAQTHQRLDTHCKTSEKHWITKPISYVSSVSS